jgi:hypothetical protein
MHTDTHHIRTPADRRTNTSIHTHTQKHTHMHTQTNTHIHTHTHTHTHIHTHTRPRKRSCNFSLFSFSCFVKWQQFNSCEPKSAPNVLLTSRLFLLVGECYYCCAVHCILYSPCNSSTDPPHVHLLSVSSGFRFLDTFVISGLQTSFHV